MCQARAKPRCSFCHQPLYIYTWQNIRTACCNNENCPLFKQPQNIRDGGDNESETCSTKEI